MSVDPETLPRCEKLDGSSLRIVPAYTEAGKFCEANCVTITDGERTAVYVPVSVKTDEKGKGESEGETPGQIMLKLFKMGVRIPYVRRSNRSKSDGQ